MSEGEVGGSQWESNPPTTQVPHNGFEARTQRRPRMASGTIVAESLQGAGGDAKLVGSKRFLPIPRSSNGRTAAFGAVNRGSNPCRGANFRVPNFPRRFC